MKLCNFRPLCWLALIVIIAISSAMLSLWLTFLGAAILFTILLWSKLPRQFKIVAMSLYIIAVISYLLTTCFVSNPTYRTYDPHTGLRGVILKYVHWYLSLFLSEDNANLIYNMLLGDKSILTFGIRSNFNVAGVAHILVVSGLHVGALYGALGTLLRWGRVPKRAHIWIIAPILLFYGYLCGWQYAIMRAVIMCLTYSFAKYHLHKADSLSVLSLAVIIILIFFPYALVSASFLLSFSCVLGIYFWYQTIFRIIPSSSLAMYLAVTLGSLPFLIYFFGNIPIFGVVANVVLVPLLMWAFYLGLFAVCTFVCGALLWLVEPLLNFVTWVLDAISQIPWATIPVNHGIIPIFIYLLGVIILSRFIFLKPKVKYSLAGVLFTCYLLLVVF